MVEIAAEAKADKRHAVEDAMSEALIRKCPKCAKPYIKDSGCNKITVRSPFVLADASVSNADRYVATSASN
jgi:TRIAD3 protein (E3 ubiquitin-protein ligase RNF216)